MLIAKSFVVVAALAPLASAFFPWIPEYRCIEEKTCLSSLKRAAEVPDARAEEAASKLPSLKIVQRIPKQVDTSHELHISRLTRRLSKKYSSRDTRVRSEEWDQQDSLAKRKNTYSIDTADVPTQTNSAGIDQDGTDYSYFAQVLFGSASTPMYMLLDTGAGSTWVMGPSCTSDACLIHNSFGAGSSTTFKAETDIFSITYGSGSVSGTLATDSLAVAGMTFSATFGIANQTSSDFVSFPMDGILGLSQAAGRTPNFLDTLKASNFLKSNVFGIHLNRGSDGGNDGEINFGTPDTSKFSGDLGYTAVDTSANGDWAISMDNVGIDGKLAGITGKLAYIDTGTSYVFAPAEDVATFHSIVPGSSSSNGVTYHIPCTTTVTMEFVFGGVSYSVLAKDWVGGSVGEGLCTSNIYGQAVIDGAWLLGDTFLKNVYTVFDIDKNRIGFAENLGSTSGTSSTGGQSSSSQTQSSSSTESHITTPSAPTLPVSSTIGNPTTSTNNLSELPSNMLPTVSTLGSTASASAATTTGTSKSTSTPEPGMSGHETSTLSGSTATSTGGAADSTSTSASHTSKSSAKRPEAGLFASFLGVVGILMVTL